MLVSYVRDQALPTDLRDIDGCYGEGVEAVDLGAVEAHHITLGRETGAARGACVGAVT